MNRSQLKEKNKQAKPSGPLDDVYLSAKKKEVGGPSGLEPTRYGDWERHGRCIDF